MRPRLASWAELALFALAVAMAAAAQAALRGQAASAGLGLAIAAIGCVAAICAPWWKPPTATPQPDEARRRDLPVSVEILLVALVFAWAAHLRFHGLTEYPPYIFVDEGHRAIEAARAAMGRDRYGSPWQVGWWSVPSLYFYYHSWIARWFGVSEFAMRVPCAVSGTLTVWAFWLLARLLYGARWAIVLGFLFASSRWHFNISRWGGEEAAMPLFWTMALIGVAAAFHARPHWLRPSPDVSERPRPAGYSWRRLAPAAIGGVGLGLMLYTYAASRLLPLALALFFLHQAVFRKRFWRRHALSALLVVLVSLAVFAPLGVFYLRHPFHLTHRFQEVSVTREIGPEKGYDALWRNVAAHLKMFHYRGDGNPRHNLPHKPMLDPVTGVLFLIGLGVAIGRPHEPPSALAFCCLLGGMAAGILTRSDQAPQTFRAIAAAPAVYLVVGLGLSRIDAALGLLRRARGWRLAWWGLCMAAAGAAAWYDASLYFGEQMANRGVRIGFNPEMTAASRAVHRAFQEDPDRQVYVWGDLHGWSTLQYFEMDKFHGGPKADRLLPFDPTAHMPCLPARTRAVSVFLRPDMRSEADLVRKFYPAAKWAEHRLEDIGTVAYRRCDIPAAMIDAARGLVAEYRPLAPGQEPIRARDRQIDFAWRKPEDLPPAMRQGFRATWKGCLAVRRTRKARFRLVSGRGTDARPVRGVVRIDGAEVYRNAAVATATQTRTLTLAPGGHALHVEAHWQPGEPGGILLLREEPGDQAQAIAGEDLFIHDMPTNGLVASYYRGAQWQGDPLFRRLERSVQADTTVHAPFSVRWEGFIDLPRDGTYRFEPVSDDGCEVYVDGRPVGWDPGPGRGQRRATPVRLGKGRHPIRIEYWDQGGGRNLTVWYFPPQGGRLPLPGDLLAPPESGLFSQ